MNGMVEYYLRGPQWANLRRTVIEAERRAERRKRQRRGVGNNATVSGNTFSARV